MRGGDVEVVATLGREEERGRLLAAKTAAKSRHTAKCRESRQMKMKRGR